MTQNQLSRYGSISRLIPDLAPSAKVFLVGDSDDTTYGVVNLASDFPADNDGVVRVYTTIQAAVNAASANRGDVILVAPGYNQSLISADSWNVAGIQVVGMGQGDRRSRLTFDTTGAQVNIGAAGVRISNLEFRASVSAITLGLDIDSTGDGSKVNNCLFSYDTNGDDFAIALRVGAKRCIIEDNEIQLEDTAGPTHGIALLGGNADNSIIKRNVIVGEFSTTAIGQDTSDTSDTDLDGVLIEDNRIINFDTATAVHIRFSAGYTNEGLVYKNIIASYDTSAADTAQIALTGLRGIENRIRSDSSEKLLP